jgi:heme A synthase
LARRKRPMRTPAFATGSRVSRPAGGSPAGPQPAEGRRFPTRTFSPATFRWLAVVTALSAYAQISLGAAVRVSGSGLGCGNDWPLCQGRIVPPLSTHAIVEYAHRTVGSLTGLLLIATLVVGWVTFRQVRPRVVWLVAAAAGTIVVEGLLGALVVFKNLAGMLVLAHLAVALALIGLVIAAAILATPVGGTTTNRTPQRLTAAAVGLTYVLLLTGAGVVANRADDTCTSWPLCGGGVRLDLSGIALYATLHRLAAGIVGLFLLYTLAIVVIRFRSVPYLATTAVVTLVLLLSQIVIGYPTATTHDLALVDGLHVAVATAVWCGVVSLAVLSRGSALIDAAAGPTGER